MGDILAQYGLAGVFGVMLVASVVFERLIPRRTHLRFCQMYEATIAQLQAALDERERQIAILLGRPTSDPSASGVGAGSSGHSS